MGDRLLCDRPGAHLGDHCGHRVVCQS
jgi:hypothetical protein